MKKQLFLFILMILPMLASAQTVSDVQNSGCLYGTRGEEPERQPTIVLTKEGNVLSVQLLNYESNCCTEDFYAIANINDGSPCSVSVSVRPTVEYDCDCICPFNLSFTIRDLEPNIFYLDCWWYKGLVELTEGQTYQATYDGSSNSYHPFLKEGKTWNYQEYYHNLWDDEQWTKDISYVINGTTEIDGKTYYKMYRTTEEGSNYFCALREEDRKVWQYTADGDHLLYDFGMSVGDSYMPSYEPLHYLLTAIKPMRFHDNQLLNVLYYDLLREEGPTNPPCHIASAPIVEGVGCEGGWNIMELYAPIPSNGILQGEDFLSCYEDGECIFTADDFNELKNPNPANNIAYRPFVEEGKVWKVGTVSGNPVQVVDYYYFDGDTIIDGKTCKQMMCQRFISPDYPDDNNLSQSPALRKVGAWYEEDKKVYFYDESKQAMRMMYDFSLNTDDPVYFIDGDYSIGPKQAGGLEGFKGVYRNIWIYRDVHSTYWLEGVGGINGPTINAYDPIYSDPVPQFLMSCAVGDEVIYFNDDYEDGTTPEGARKHRFDFTHTIKTQPKAPMMRAAEQSLYGEYNEQQLGINLNPLDNAYLVRITDESGKVVYEKTVNTGIIVGLNIDISAYTKGRYAVSVENSHEIFTGEFEAQTTGIEDYAETGNIKNGSIYNLQGQRVSCLQKGLMIVNGKKVHVK